MAEARKNVNSLFTDNILDPDIKGQSQKGWLWVYSRPGGEELFEWRPRQSREGSEEFLKNIRGRLQNRLRIAGMAWSLFDPAREASPYFRFSSV
jgi:hypothetical protein